MSSILASIIEGVLEDVKLREIPMSQLRREVEDGPELRDVFAALQSPSGEIRIIAEIKRASPSKGLLSVISDPAALAEQYENAGANVISVLTERRRFNGAIADFTDVRARVSTPLLRKDFIVTEYQVFESRAIGADLMLLIVAGLTQTELRDFYDLATGLGMKVLVEVHNESELERAIDIESKIIGVNSRNLKTLEIDNNVFARLLPMIPDGIVKIAESGITEREQVAALEEIGVDAILVGETLVRSSDPRAAIIHLLGH